MGLVDAIINKWWRSVDKKDKERLAKKTPISGIFEQNDIPYLDDGKTEHLLDIYRPEDTDGLLPVIIDIHGGGWSYGSKELNKYYCLDLSRRGFAVVNINYSLMPDYNITTSVRDIFAAFAFVAANGERFGLDTNNVFITGDSAGGHYTALSTAIINEERLQKLFGVTATVRPNAIGLTCGVYDLAPTIKIAKGLGILYIKRLFDKQKGFETTELFKACCVNNNDISAFPPVFMNSSYADFLREQNFMFNKLLLDNGIECEFDYYEKSESGNKLEHVFNVCYPEWPESVKTNDKLCNFFRAHIKA